MSGAQKNILTRRGRKSGSLIRSAIVLCCALLFFYHDALWAQVISNNGASISITSGTVVVTDTVENVTGTIANNGTLSLQRMNNAATLQGNGAYNVAHSFANSGTFTAGTSTVDFNGAGLETIPALDFYNLTSSSTGARTLASSGTIGISSTFTPGTNTYTVTGSTVNFNGTSAQAVPSFTYNNLTISNATDTSAANYKAAANTLTVGGALTINSGNTLDMGSFASSTFGGGSTNSGKIRWSADNVYVSGTGTTEFYSSSAGNIAAGINYGNLWFNGTGTKTIGAGVAVIATGGTAAFGVTISNNLTVSATGSLTVTSMDLNVNGPIANSGNITVE